MPEGLFQLTAFQRDLLYVAAGRDRPSGREVKDEIESVYNRDITHGRLYPNLDVLAEKGFIEKGEINRRKNYYEVTSHGDDQLEDRRDWENEYLPSDQGRRGVSI